MSVSDEVGIPYPTQDRVDDVLLKRLHLAWNAITKSPDYIKKCKEASLKYGDGISVFRFLGSPQLEKPDPKIPNCEYYYADTQCDLWKMLVETNNIRAYFHDKHRYGVTFAVCISMPLPSHHDEYIQSIKLFSVDNNQEIV